MSGFMRILYVLFFFPFSFLYASEPFCNLDERYPDPIVRQKFIEKELYTDPAFISGIRQALATAKTLFEANNVTYWIHFGTLLGAVREREIIPWDDDGDLGLLEEEEKKIEALKGAFLEKGYNLFRDINEKGEGENIVGYKLYARTPLQLSSGQQISPFIDLFLYQRQKDHYILSCEKGRAIFPNSWFAPEQITQRTRYQIGEQEFWGPSNAEVFFERRYGAAWKTQALHYKKHYEPHPKKYVWSLFHFKAPRVAAAQDNPAYWDHFYGKVSFERKPSSFCQFLLEKGYVLPGKSLVELGCGNGRDTFEFFRKGTRAVGLDLSREAIESNTMFAQSLGAQKPAFHCANVMDPEKMREFTNSDYVYARFFLHSIPQEAENAFLNFLNELNPGATVFLEFRTDKDPLFKQSQRISDNEGISQGIDGHYRRYINFEKFSNSLTSLGFVLGLAEEKDGISVRGDDNPVLGRLIAVKK